MSEEAIKFLQKGKLTKFRELVRNDISMKVANRLKTKQVEVAKDMFKKTVKESIERDLKDISRSSKGGSLKLKDGDEVDVDQKTAEELLKNFRKLPKDFDKDLNSFLTTLDKVI